MENNKLLINKGDTVLNALLKLNEIRNLHLILFVYDKNKKIIGSITDGDIRRYIIKNSDLNVSIDRVCNKNFSFIYENTNYSDFSSFKEKKIKILPVLDKKHRFINIIELDKVNSILPLECVIMAGGKGKRLSPLTDNKPKPMLKIGDEPILENNINRLISYGIKKIYISVNYLADQIQNYFGDGSSKNIEIIYIKEEKFLGTAGSLSLIKKINTSNFILMNADIFSNINFALMLKQHLKLKSIMTIASTNYNIDVPYAILEEKNKQVLKLSEKPSYNYYSNAGIYILNKSLLKTIPKNKFFDITDLISILLKEKKKIYHFPILGYWIDIGTPDDFYKAQEEIKHLN